VRAPGALRRGPGLALRRGSALDRGRGAETGPRGPSGRQRGPPAGSRKPHMLSLIWLINTVIQIYIFVPDRPGGDELADRLQRGQTRATASSLWWRDVRLQADRARTPADPADSPILRWHRSLAGGADPAARFSCSACSANSLCGTSTEPCDHCPRRHPASPEGAAEGAAGL